MKKLIICLISLGLIFSMCACGGGGKTTFSSFYDYISEEGKVCSEGKKLSKTVADAELSVIAAEDGQIILKRDYKNSVGHNEVDIYLKEGETEAYVDFKREITFTIFGKTGSSTETGNGIIDIKEYKKGDHFTFDEYNEMGTAADDDSSGAEGNITEYSELLFKTLQDFLKEYDSNLSMKDLGFENY